MTQRDTTRVLRDILRVIEAHHPRFTHIVQKANTNPTQLYKHLPYLMERGFVMKRERHYFLTNAGTEMLKELNQTIRHLYAPTPLTEWRMWGE